MRKTLAICKKELYSYFTSPIAYIVLSAWLFLCGFFFAAILVQIREASIRYTASNMAVILLFFCPFLTMRLYAEEMRTNTIELLNTSPISNIQIILGKYLASFSLLAIMVLLTIEFPVFLFAFGEPDIGPIITSYLGLLLLGGSFLAVGVFASSLTQNQMIAAVVTFAILLTLWIIGWSENTILDEISIIGHFESFSQGVINTVDLAYYIIFSALWLFLTIRVLDFRKWR